MNLVGHQLHMISTYVTCILLISLLVTRWKNRRVAPAFQHALDAGSFRGTRGYSRNNPSSGRQRLGSQDVLVLKAMVGDATESAPVKTNGTDTSKLLASDSPVERQAPTAMIPLPEVTDEAFKESASAAGADESPAHPLRSEASSFFVQPVEQLAPTLGAECGAALVIPPPIQEAERIEQFVPFAQLNADIDLITASAEDESAELVALAPEILAGECCAPIMEQPIQEEADGEEIAPAPAMEEFVAPLSVPAVHQDVKEAIAQSFPGPSVEEKTAAPSFLSFYGLQEQPFGVTPDPAYLYLSKVHRDAFTSLSQGIQNLRGFVALVAEPGMGKTTLLNKLMEELRDSARVVFLFQTQCNSRELLRHLLSELGVPSAGMDLVKMHKTLNEILFKEMLQGRRFVLIVDEAQNLRESALETIRLLSDFETTHAKLLQIVLAGQPQLVDTLMQPNLSQLRQRISVLASLEALNAAETANYVEHRLRAAGASGEPIFTPDAVALIAEKSQGTPRKINNICFGALMLGFSEGRRTIDADIVQKVVAKLDLESFARRPEPREALVKPEPMPDANSASELARLLLATLASEPRAKAGSGDAVPASAGITLSGKITEMIKTWHGGKENEYRVQVSLRREASSEIPVADRYYSCSFYVTEELAKGFRAGQAVRIKIERD
jgi:general secretion pathway protein A